MLCWMRARTVVTNPLISRAERPLGVAILVALLLSTSAGVLACGDDTETGADTTVSDVTLDTTAIDDAETGADTTVSDVALDTTATSDTETGADTTVSDVVLDTTGDDLDGLQDSGATADDVAQSDTTVVQTGSCYGSSEAEAVLSDASVPEGFCVWQFAAGLTRPRGIQLLDNGDVLVVDQGIIVQLWDADGDGVSSDLERATIVVQGNLNHGVVVHGDYLYASSDTTVFRWVFDDLMSRSDLGEPELVVSGMPRGGHSTRTLVFDDEDRLYVSVGSGSNVDGDSSRSRIIRVVDVSSPPEGGFDFAATEVFADGLRNEVGLAFDGAGQLWGVENGVDNLMRPDLGGDIHNDNPAEELNVFAEAGQFYGYPYCWSEFLLPEGVGGGPNTQWAHPDFSEDGTHSDAWCQNVANVVAPHYAMQAHSAPLDLLFYEGEAFPEGYRGDIFVTFHGSWNRDVPTGYKVVRLDRDAEGDIVAELPLLEYGGAGDLRSDWQHRPVSLAVGQNGELFITSDRSGTILVLGYRGAE